MGLLLGFSATAALALALYYGLGWTKTIFGDATMYAMFALFLSAYLGLIAIASRYPDLQVDTSDAPLTVLPEIGPTARTGLHFFAADGGPGVVPDDRALFTWPVGFLGDARHDVHSHHTTSAESHVPR